MVVRSASILLFVLAAGCGSDSLSLTVDLRTDLAPAMEFSTVDVELFNASSLDGEARRTVDAARSDDFLGGARVAEYKGLDAGDVVLQVDLRDSAGAVVVGRELRVTVSGDTGITVLLTRDCVEVTCPASDSGPNATQCRGGRCVEPRCSELDREACGMGGCARDADCGCSDGRCVEDVCFCAGPTRPSCEAGMADCDGDSNNGCETDTSTDSSNCGGCGGACRLGHADATCADGSCLDAILRCDAQWEDCDSDPSNGCETTLATLTDCGGCGLACSASNAMTDCSTGACEIVLCDTGRGDCNGDIVDGCETDLTTDPDHCGACDAACAGTIRNATASCMAGACTLVSCDAGWGNCDGDDSDGCENSLSSTSNCGRCGRACSIGQRCCSGRTCNVLCM